MTIEVTRRPHLGQSGKNGAVDHQFEVITHHDTVVVIVLPAANFLKRLLRAFTPGKKIDNDGRQNQPYGDRVGVGGRTDTCDLPSRVAIDTGTHIECRGDTCLMQHREEVEHAPTEALRCKQEP